MWRREERRDKSENQMPCLDRIIYQNIMCEEKMQHYSIAASKPLI
jgi:hypothetical protein